LSFLAGAMTNHDNEEHQHEKERDEGPADPLAAVGRPENDEDIDEEKEIAEAAASPARDLDEAASLREQTEDIKRLRSYASVTSINSADAVARPSDAPAAKKWYRKLNPLRWGGIPPVPEVRTVCPEAKASFFNKLFFQWQASLMQVRPPGALPAASETPCDLTPAADGV